MAYDAAFTIIDDATGQSRPLRVSDLAVRGKGVLHGEAPPASGLGVVDEFYFELDDDVPARIYGPKTTAGWGTGFPLATDAGTPSGPVAIGDVTGLTAALALLQDKATAATDTEVAAAVSTAQTALTAAIALKQDGATAATDAEVEAVRATLAASISALNSAVTTSLASKQDASLAATDAEVEAIRATLAVADALKIPLSQKGVANGVAALDSAGRVPVGQLASGTPDGTKFVRDDGILAVPPGGGSGGGVQTYSGALPGDVAAGTILIKADGTGLAFAPGPFGGQVISQSAPPDSSSPANSVILVGSSVYLVPS